jgi:hypothetical protein
LFRSAFNADGLTNSIVDEMIGPVTLSPIITLRLRPCTMFGSSRKPKG